MLIRHSPYERASDSHLYFNLHDEAIQELPQTQPPPGLNSVTLLVAYGAFPLHGTVQYGTLWGFPLGTVPGTWYFF